MSETGADCCEDFLHEFDLSEEEYEQERSMYSGAELSDAMQGTDLFTSLFDMSTVKGVDKRGTIIQSEMITVPRIILGKGKKISFTEDTMISYTEVEVPQRNKILRTSMSDHALILPLRKGCGHDKSFTDHYMVPSLRLNVKEDKEYIEPVRDREKIWTLDSQRDMLTGETAEAILKEKRALKLGLYPKLPPNPALHWSPTLQTLLRKRRITRTAIVISDTHCFVDIYGLGVSGRVLAPGAPTSRMLLMEAYSIWDSTKYTMQVAVPLLKTLLAGQEHLFLPGKKMELMKAILLLLYFEYTITYEEEQVLVPTSLEGTSVGTRSAGNSRRNSRLSTGSNVGNSKNNIEEMEYNHDPVKENNNDNSRDEEGEASTNRGQGSRPRSRPAGSGGDSEHQEDKQDAPLSSVVTHTYRVTHLDKFRLPDTFPQNIADIIRVNSTKPELLDMNCPKLTQHLKISPITRENGPVVRRREAKEKARLDALEELRKRQEWAAIPKRYKGLYAQECRRKYGKWIMMSLYRMPSKPTILVVKGFCPIECVSVPHFLDLKLLGKMFGVKTPPLMWTEQTIKQVVKSIGRQVDVSEGDARLALLVSHPTSSGPATQLGPLKSCIGFENRRSVPLSRKIALPARDPLIPDIPLNEDRQYSSNVPKIGKNSRKQRRLYTGDTPHNCLSHRRDIGKKGLRVTQRGKKIGHAYGIYTLYVTSKMNTGPIGPFKELEQEILDKKYANQVIPSHLAPKFEITVEIYFSVNPTYSARMSGSPLESFGFGGGVSSAPVVLKLVFSRRDLCRLIADKVLLRYCLRIGHGFSYEDASAEEVEEMEQKWTQLMNCLFSRCRWRQGHRPEAMDLVPMLSDDTTSNNHIKVNNKETDQNKRKDKQYQYESKDILTKINPSTIKTAAELAVQYRNRVEKAMQMMSGYASDISAQQLVKDPGKMITPLPAMKGPPRRPDTAEQLVDVFADDYVGEAFDFAAITERAPEASLQQKKAAEEEKLQTKIEEVECEKEEVASDMLLLDKSNELVLSVPYCIYNKTCRVASDVVRRPNVFLQIMVWQHDCELGIVAFDPELHDVYFVQSTPSQQEILCEELEPADATEVSINMGILMMSLIYTEKEYDLETGEEIDVSLRVLEEESESDHEDSDSDWGEEMHDVKAVKKKEVEGESGGRRKKNKRLSVEQPLTRVQGFLTLAEDIPEDSAFVNDEEENTEANIDNGEEDMDAVMETGRNIGDEDDSVSTL